MLKKNLKLLSSRIAVAAKKSGRDASEITLLAVTKKVEALRVREAYALGVRHFAENYVQEALRKQQALEDYEIDWHFIGHIQSNKVKELAGRFALIHSVDREKLIHELENKSAGFKAAPKSAEKPLPRFKQKILIEVNLAGEVSKCGCRPEDLPHLIELTQKQKHLQLAGLMFMPPLDLTETEQRRFYENARELREQMQREISKPHSLVELSMGTSHDFEIAIEAGATIVRLGTVIFGERT